MAAAPRATLAFMLGLSGIIVIRLVVFLRSITLTAFGEKDPTLRNAFLD
jgi:hypothetical protein